MRLALTALLALALPAAAAAQKGSGRGASHGHSPAVAPWMSMTSTLPPIGLGLPPIGLAPPSKPQFKFGSPRFDRFQGNPHFDSRKHSFGSVVYVLPPFYPGIFAPYTDFFSPDLYSSMPGLTPLNYVAPAPPQPPPPPPLPLPATGWLRLDLDQAPAGSQIFVDGYFVGTLDDVNGQVTLDAGPHKIEVQAPGYRALAFDVKIVADRSITYERALERLDGVVKRAEPTPARSTI
jgi:PEGA domain